MAGVSLEGAADKMAMSRPPAGGVVVEHLNAVFSQFVPRHLPLFAQLRSFSSKAFVYRR